MEFSLPELTAAAKRAQPFLSHRQAETRALCALMILSGSPTGAEINGAARRLSGSVPESREASQ